MKSKSLASFSFSFNFPQIWCSFWDFQKEPQNKEKEQEKRNSQNIGFSFSFWRPPTKECEKRKCNQGVKQTTPSTDGLINDERTSPTHKGILRIPLCCLLLLAAFSLLPEGWLHVNQGDSVHPWMTSTAPVVNAIH